jgi:hypothetical protein
MAACLVTEALQPFCRGILKVNINTNTVGKKRVILRLTETGGITLNTGWILCMVFNIPDRPATGVTVQD